MGRSYSRPGGGALAAPPRDRRVRPRGDRACHCPELANVRGVGVPNRGRSGPRREDLTHQGANRTQPVAEFAARWSMTRSVAAESPSARYIDKSLSPSERTTMVLRGGGLARRRVSEVRDHVLFDAADVFIDVR